MKKIILGLVGVGAIAALAWAGVFYSKNLRGAGPAVRAPSGDIAELIRGGESENTTGMPLKLPPGFSIEVFAKDLPGARVITRDPYGNVVVSLTKEGKVLALPDDNGDGVADEVVTLITGLNKPHGIRFRCADSDVCDLFIAEEHRVSEFIYDRPSIDDTNVRHVDLRFERVVVDLPTGGHHTTRTLGFGPDGRLYVAIGSSCNVCNENDPRRAAIYVVDIENNKLIPFASGLRNSVFFTWNPVGGKMWGTEMGRDLLGDDLPPDEINILTPSPQPSPLKGEGVPNYGWPICYGKNVHDSIFDKNQYVRDPCADKESSYIDLPAHSAPLGLAFISKDAGWPKEYEGDLLVAFHGSWNRSEPTGYKIARIKLDAKEDYEGMEDFISGWLQKDGTALGRPVDILIQPGGVMYISDDKAGVIYKVTYTDG